MCVVCKLSWQVPVSRRVSQPGWGSGSLWMQAGADRVQSRGDRSDLVPKKPPCLSPSSRARLSADPPDSTLSSLLPSALCLAQILPRSWRHEAQTKVAFLWGDRLGQERGQSYPRKPGLALTFLNFKYACSRLKPREASLFLLLHLPQ